MGYHKCALKLEKVFVNESEDHIAPIWTFSFVSLVTMFCFVWFFFPSWITYNELSLMS